MERKSIAIEDTWDLSRIYANKQEFYTDLEKAKDLLSSLFKINITPIVTNNRNTKKITNNTIFFFFILSHSKPIVYLLSR